MKKILIIDIIIIILIKNYLKKYIIYILFKINFLFSLLYYNR